MLLFSFIGRKIIIYGSNVHLIEICHHLLCQIILPLEELSFNIQRLLNSRNHQIIVQYILAFYCRSS